MTEYQRKRKQQIIESFPLVSRESFNEAKSSILNSDLSIDEQIRQLEFMKTEILAGGNPIKYFREFKKYCKSTDHFAEMIARNR